MEREIQLLEYLPEISRSIKDYKVLLEAEAPELIQLFEELEQLQKNGFITTADLQGIKRWEQLLNIMPDSIDLEERRAAVLGRWNRSLPYTLHRLKECLDVLVGRNGYQINLQPQAYFFELFAENQPLSMLHTMRSLTKEMLPANLIFSLVNHIPTEILQQIKVTSGLVFNSMFYPRYNLGLLYLDGAQALDGSSVLAGYQSEISVEFYPSRLRLLGQTFTPVKRDSQVIYLSSIHSLFTSDLLWQNRSSFFEKVQTKERMSWLDYIYKIVKVAQKTFYFSKSEVNIRTDIQEKNRSFVPFRQAITEQLSLSNPIIQNTKTKSTLSIEKDLYYLDGSELLDGSRMLDADILNETL